MYNWQRLVFWQRHADSATAAVTVTSDADTFTYTPAGDQCPASPAGWLGGGGSANFGSCGAPNEDGSSTQEEPTTASSRTGKDKDKSNQSWLFSMEMNAQVG